MNYYKFGFITTNNLKRLMVGFTLIESLVVICIISIFTEIAILAIISSHQQRQVNNTADKIKNIILETRSYATTRPSYIDSSAQVIEIQIDKTTNLIKFCQKTGCPPGSQINPPLVSDTSIPNDIKFISSDNPIQIDIDIYNSNSLGQLISPTPSCLQLGNSRNSIIYHLNINTYGEIDVAQGNC